MSATYDVVAAEAEKAATVLSIADIVGTTLTDAKGFLCVWFGIQNKDGAKSLYVQDDNDATVANDNIEIAPGVTYRAPTCNVKFDLREVFVRVSADDPVFSIEILWG